MSFKAYIIPIIFFLLGLILIILGGLFRVLHWEIGPLNGGFLLAIGALTAVIAICFVILLLLIQLFKKN